MYESYWQLTHKPFDSGANPKVYYPGEAHQGALLKLRYAIESGRGAALLAGPSGTGKTLLIRLLAEQLPEEFSPFVHLMFPRMPAADLLAFIAGELTDPAAPAASATVAESVHRIQRRLNDNRSQGRHAIIVIDDAHLLEGNDAFEALRLLLNFEFSGVVALTLLFVGQPGLLPAFERMPHLEERLGAKCLLRSLSLEETMSYVQYRLHQARASRTIFDASAVEAIFHLAHGVPRRINRLCDLALLIGFAEEQPLLSATHVEAVANELAGVSVE